MGLPPATDRRWASAPLAGGGETRFLPLGPPYLPRLSSAASWLEEGASLVILSDGYPARLVDGEVVVHPLHGRYVLEDLLRRHESSGSEELRDAIRLMADAIMSRAQPAGERLLMWYEPHVASTMAGRTRHTSGLAQAYYAALLARVAEITGDGRYADAADRYFAPLTIEVDDGGLLHRGGPGPSLAMAPIRPRDWVLNGWLSMIVASSEYGRRRRRSDAADLVASNIATLETVIGAFDAPVERLSRYTLLGMLLVKLVIIPFSDGVQLRGARTWIPGEPDEVPIEITDRTGWTPRWIPGDVAPEPGSNRIRANSRTPRLVIKLSRAPFPQPNELRLTIDTPQPIAVRLEAFIGGYEPLASSTSDRTWVALGSSDVPAGGGDLAFRLAYDPIDLFSYPTNFAREFAGRPTNTYHATHIVRLRQLAAISGSRVLAEWARRWRAYADEWDSIGAYHGFRCWSPEGEI